MTLSPSGGATGTLPSPPAPSVFDGPRGRRRALLLTAGLLVWLVCTGVLALARGVLHADPRAPAATSVGTAGTGRASAIR